MAEEVKHGFWNTFQFQTFALTGLNENVIDEKSKTGKEEKKNPTLDQFLLERFRTRRNLINKEIEIKSIKPSQDFQKLISKGREWSVMDDTKLNQMFFDAKIAGVKYLSSKRTITDRLNSGFSTGYDPMSEYVNSIVKWDGETDYISIEFNKRVKAKNQKLAAWMFKKWFVGMIATAIGDVVKTNETALILKGRQNLGKTRFIGNLLPPLLREYTMSGILNPNDKDHLFRLTTNFIYNLDELASMKASNVEKFKHIMSTDRVKARRPFAHFDANEKVICSFTGTVNDEVFLHDLTGNRRFLVVDVVEIDTMDNMPHDKMFAQAVELNKNGFRWWFNDEDVTQMKSHTEQYRFKSPIEELIMGRFVPAKDKDEAGTYLNPTEILNQFKKEGIQVTDTNAHKVGKVMTKLKFKHKKIGGLKKYAIDFVKKDSENLEGLINQNDVSGPGKGYEDIPY